LKYGASAFSRVGPFPKKVSDFDIPTQNIWMARSAPPLPMPVCLQFGTERGGRGRARGELKTVRRWGRDTRTIFEGEREKRFGVAAGRAYGANVSKIVACIEGAIMLSSECPEKMYVTEMI
jgi:hypothetical protein